MTKKLISIVTPVYNEEGNIQSIYSAIKEIFTKIDKYSSRQTD